MLRDMVHLGKVGVHLDDAGFGSIAKNQVVPGPMDRTPATPPTLVGTAHAARLTGGKWRKINSGRANGVAKSKRDHTTLTPAVRWQRPSIGTLQVASSTGKRRWNTQAP